MRSVQSQARYLFTSEEFAKQTGREPKSVALKMALQRLSKQGRIILALKKPAKWLIVPPEHMHYGAPPIDWWLDDCLKDIEPDYYVALLSAARYWGSSHYALQSMQIMVTRPRPSLNKGRLQVDFVVKKNLDATPTMNVRMEVASMRVSTREATLLDLVRHQARIGGLEAVARIAKDFAGDITGKGLTEALDALDQVAAAQRLGFIFDRLHLERWAKKVASWLEGKRFVTQPLELPGGSREPSSIAAMNAAIDERWNIRYTDAQLAIVEELR